MDEINELEEIDMLVGIYLWKELVHENKTTKFNSKNDVLSFASKLHDKILNRISIDIEIETKDFCKKYDLNK